MSKTKFVFCENCKRVFKMYTNNHINECPACDVPNSMPEIPECVASELARRDADIVTLNNRLTDAITLNSELVEKIESRDERSAR